MNRKPLVLPVSIVLCLAAATVVGWRFWISNGNSRGHGSDAKVRETVAGDSSERERNDSSSITDSGHDLSASLENGDEHRRVAAETIGRSTLVLSETMPGPILMREQLAESVQSVISAYLSDDIQPFRAYCVENGIDPFPNESDVHARMWSRFSRWFGTAVFDVERIAVRWRLQNGLDAGEIEPNDMEPGESIVTGTRDEARRSWIDVPEDQRNSIEIVIPMIAKDLNAMPFESKFGLELGFDTTTQRWMIVRIRHYNLPLGTSIVPAPL